MNGDFELKCLFTLKIGLTLANSDRTACTNMLSNNSDGWHLSMQACFSLKIQHISQSGPLVTWFLRVTANRKNAKRAYF